MPTKEFFVKSGEGKKVILQKDQLILKKKHVFHQNVLDKNQKIHSKLLNNRKRSASRNKYKILSPFDATINAIIHMIIKTF